MDGRSGPGMHWLWVGVILLAAIFAVSRAGLRPPPPKSTSAPSSEFSAGRALRALRRVLGRDLPHPLGSPANGAVRARIVKELTLLGYRPQVQTAFSCSSYESCATVNNVVARLNGTDHDGAVLLAAHYDSVPAAPGDSDDGSGVAVVLEIARALKSMPPPRHSIILLLDDGEEDGLLGARAFVNSSPWAQEVRGAVNLDARGTSSPSLMFETGTANEWAVRLYARHAARPVTSSIFYSIYKRLPNDTDFTVFKAAGYQGLNFAFVGDPAQYHTPLDNAANFQSSTLQQQGQDALSAILALANSDLSGLSKRDAVYFDLFGRKVIYWPARWTVVFAILALLLLLGQSWRLMVTKRATWHGILWGAIAFPAIMVTIAFGAFILRVLIGLAGATPTTWIAHPTALETAFGSLALAAVVSLAIFFSRRGNFWDLWSGLWICGAILSVVIGAVAPSVSYIVLVPAAVAAITGLPATIPRREIDVLSGAAAILPLAAAALVLSPLALLLYQGVGNSALVLIALTAGLIFAPLVPLCTALRGVARVHRMLFRLVPVLATGLATVAAITVPVYSAKSPQRVNFEYWQNADSETSRWVVEPDSGRLPKAIRRAAAFQREPNGVFPWDTSSSYISAAPYIGLAPPTFTILQSSVANGRRSYTTLLRSERGAPFAAIFFPPNADVESVRINGQLLESESLRIRQRLNGWMAYSCPAMPAAGIEIDFSLPVGKPAQVSAMDRSYGLPPGGMFLLRSRPLTATSSQFGDETTVTRRVELFP